MTITYSRHGARRTRLIDFNPLKGRFEFLDSFSNKDIASLINLHIHMRDPSGKVFDYGARNGLPNSVNITRSYSSIDPNTAPDYGNLFTITTNLRIRRNDVVLILQSCLLYTSPSPRDRTRSRMPSSA